MPLRRTEERDGEALNEGLAASNLQFSSLQLAACGSAVARGHQLQRALTRCLCVRGKSTSLGTN